MDYPASDSKETWHVHDDDTWGWGVSCDDPEYHPGRGFAKQPAPMALTVPGGFNDQNGGGQWEFQRDFDPGMDAYKKARDEGLQPKQTTLKAVKEAQREVKIHQRANKKLGIKADETNSPAGVE